MKMLSLPRCVMIALVSCGSVLVNGAPAFTQVTRGDTHGRRATPHADASLYPSLHAPRALGGVAGDEVPDWISRGPFGGDVCAVAVSPIDPELVLAGIAPAGGAGGTLYRSTDGAASWAIVVALDGLSVHDIAFTPSGTVYLGTTSGVQRSDDGGVTLDAFDLGIGANQQVFEVVIHPNDEDEVWIGIGDALGSQDVNIMRTTNGGDTWSDMTPPMPFPISGKGIGFKVGDPDTVYACFGGAFGGGDIWVSTNGGDTWVDRSAGLPTTPIQAVIHDGARVLLTGGLLFGSQDFGLFESFDDGANWNALHDDSWPMIIFNDIDLDPNNTDVILLGSLGTGVYRSSDGGKSWEFGIGATGSFSLNAVKFAPGESDRIFLGASSAGVIQSTDGGDEFNLSSEGIGALNVVDVAVNGLDPNEIAIAFQGLNDGGVFSSTDGGVNWVLEDAPPTRYNTVLFAPDGRLHALSDGPTTIAPEGLYRRDFDHTWTVLGPDQGDLFESELFALRFSVNDPDLILSGGSDFGVAGAEPTIWRSTDDGQTWEKVYERGTDNEDVTDIEIIEDGEDTTFLATFVDFGGVQDGGVLRSTDAGDTWENTSTGLPEFAQGRAICAWPSDINTFYLADGDFGGGNGGVHISTDGGQTWSTTGYVAPLVLDIICDPDDDQVLYICEFDADKVRRSTDGGATFDLFNTGLDISGSAATIAYAGGASPQLFFATGNGTYSTNLTPGIVGDINGDGVVDGADLILLLGAWGPCDDCNNCPADLDGDCTIGAADLITLLGNWG